MEETKCEEKVSVIINVCGHNMTRCSELLKEQIRKMNLPEFLGDLNITVKFTVCDA